MGGPKGQAGGGREPHYSRSSPNPCIIALQIFSHSVFSLRYPAMAPKLPNDQKMLRRSALFATAYGSLALAGAARSQEKSTIAGIHEAVESFVDRKEIAGAVTMVVDKDRVLHLDAAGYADLTSKTPMTPDHLFWIASMSKPITAICVMMLVDEGKIALDDPIARYLPQMGGLRNESAERVNVSVLQTLNHTSGMRELDAPYADTSLANAVEKYAKSFVQFQPGTKWQYSQTGINTAAHIVEVVSEMSFDAFLHKRIEAHVREPAEAFGKKLCEDSHWAADGIPYFPARREKANRSRSIACSQRWTVFNTGGLRSDLPNAFGRWDLAG
jgi:CubicO group peptidase (beta-lactamase class C family)